VDALQKRVRVLEAGNLKLRMAVQAAEDAAAQSAAAASRATKPGTPDNEPPNAGGEGGEGEGNPVIAKWEADKRLQKRVDALAAKLKVGVSGGGSFLLEHVE
jgi:hypothetical protein